MISQRGWSRNTRDNGFFLGVADAFLFAVKQGKSLAIAVDPQSDRALEVLSARDYLCGILPENIQIERREGDDLDTKKDQRIGADFIRETQGHQNAYYILMSVFCYARQNDERSYCMNLCKILLLSSCLVSVLLRLLSHVLASTWKIEVILGFQNGKKCFHNIVL